MLQPYQQVILYQVGTKASVLSVKTLADMFDFGDNLKHIKDETIGTQISQSEASCTEC